MGLFVRQEAALRGAGFLCQVGDGSLSLASVEAHAASKNAHRRTIPWAQHATVDIVMASGYVDGLSIGSRFKEDRMKLKILSVKEQGDANAEYLMLQALEDCNLSNYAIVDNTYDSNGAPSNKLRHTYFFPSTQVKKGDYISLHTKAGRNAKAETTNGNPLYRFYWGLATSVWNDTGDTVHLLEISGISKLRIPAKA
ncbi:hypothetical protein [Pseudomonas promysalinigenes]|uniref:hypothetical protein n=1 Tax=Pseudomonas promysalinigenes TaxID=485898 RepID=UPI003FA01567